MEGWHGWDEYARYYDWENAQTVGRRDIEFWQLMAQQADGYLARAQSELLQAEGVSKTSPAQEARYLSMAHRDLERAIALYEPIDGFSNVNSNLQRLYADRSKKEQLQADYELAARQRRRRWR